MPSDGLRFFFSSPCQRQSELLPSLGIRRPLTFHILIFSSETPHISQMNWNLVGSIYGRSSFGLNKLCLTWELCTSWVTNIGHKYKSVISQALINTYDKKKVINIFIAQEYVSWLESDNYL
jgi:hypothetical protein